MVNEATQLVKHRRRIRLTLNHEAGLRECRHRVVKQPIIGWIDRVAHLNADLAGDNRIGQRHVESGMKNGHRAALEADALSNTADVEQVRKCTHCAFTIKGLEKIPYSGIIESKIGPSGGRVGHGRGGQTGSRECKGARPGGTTGISGASGVCFADINGECLSGIDLVAGAHTAAPEIPVLKLSGP